MVVVVVGERWIYIGLTGRLVRLSKKNSISVYKRNNLLLKVNLGHKNHPKYNSTYRYQTFGTLVYRGLIRTSTTSYWQILQSIVGRSPISWSIRVVFVVRDFVPLSNFGTFNPYSGDCHKVYDRSDDSMSTSWRCF